MIQNKFHSTPQRLHKTPYTSLAAIAASLRRRVIKKSRCYRCEKYRINTKHFELERSKDGISFTKLATIPALNTGGDHSYGFTDLQPMNGRNHYRLRMVDIDGSYTNSKIVSVDMNKPVSSPITAVYPNPVKDVINIAVAINERLIVDLVAPDGRRILTKSIGSPGVHTINVSGLAPGLYFLKVSNGEMYKLIKE